MKLKIRCPECYGERGSELKHKKGELVHITSVCHTCGCAWIDWFRPLELGREILRKGDPDVIAKSRKRYLDALAAIDQAEYHVGRRSR